VKLLAILLFMFSSRCLALINAKPLSGEPDVVRLVFENGWFCSGVFIDPYTILTAAHCFVDPEHAAPIRLKKILSQNDEAIDVKQINAFAHPEIRDQYWPRYDVGIIKTSPNEKFKGSFAVESTGAESFGRAILFGCGRTEARKKSRARTVGENQFLKLGSVLIFWGKSKSSNNVGFDVTIAPNDSGGPILSKRTGNIIAVSTQTTAEASSEYGVPAIGLATSILEDTTLKFIQSHLGEASSTGEL
jgi:hypothetical protein